MLNIDLGHHFDFTPTSSAPDDFIVYKVIDNAFHDTCLQTDYVRFVPEHGGFALFEIRFAIIAENNLQTQVIITIYNELSKLTEYLKSLDKTKNFHGYVSASCIQSYMKKRTNEIKKLNALKN